MHTPHERYDIYGQIHRALRAAMSQTLVDLGRVDAASDVSVETAMQDVDNLLKFCLGHLEHENVFVHAAMDARRPGSSHKTASDHDQHLSAIDMLTRDIGRVRSSSGAERRARLLALYQHLSGFVAENFEHMLIEESYNNAVLWDLYTDAEIEQIERNLVASIPPPQAAEVMRHMLPAISQPERIEKLGQMRAAMPGEAFRGLFEMILPLVPQADRVRLEAALA
ncbi:hypothetical protein E4T66_13795 [Sinimarinibacterium sp. CAU 1509]|uniref:hypothetical protein n=1 Tax=Sinimarinibacterium sp. CAU 1509 TaxID=2562283 RepID=UPI0010AC6394|nr:hypothetical protein [Sinimarinibacterium sp. CAU 1509]TJY59454.1 hypothetical protein E4T66_13795 [Sinimarinibacterium sp. CAU 1509]